MSWVSVVEDPESGKDLTPPSLHRYLYAYANPTAYVDTDGRMSMAAGGAILGATSGVAQSAGRMLYDSYWGEWQGWSNYGSVIAQNTIAGAEIGFALDATRGGANPGTGALVGGAVSAGISGLTLDGTARDWTTFGNNQVKHGTGGAVAGALLASGQPGAAAASLGMRYGAAGVAGATSGYAGDLTTQGVEFVTGERTELDYKRLNIAAAFGAFANMVPVAAGQVSQWRDNAARARALTQEVAESTSPAEVQLVWSSSKSTQRNPQNATSVVDDAAYWTAVETQLSDAVAARASAISTKGSNEYLTRTQRGPVLTGAMDPQTGDIFYGLNQGRVPSDLHPVLQRRLDSYLEATGGITPPRAGIPGSHSEVVALDQAIKAREMRHGVSVTEDMVPEFLLSNRALIGERRVIGIPPRCANCAPITDGVHMVGGD